MGDIIERRTVELNWNEVCGIVSEKIKDILGLYVQCEAIISDDSHWCVKFIDYRLPLPKLRQLLQAAQSTPEEWEDAMPDEGAIDIELGMALSERLIARHLNLTWEHRLITEDSLLLVGVTKDSCQFTDKQLAELIKPWGAADNMTYQEISAFVRDLRHTPYVGAAIAEEAAELMAAPLLNCFKMRRDDYGRIDQTAID